MPILSDMWTHSNCPNKKRTDEPDEEQNCSYGMHGLFSAPISGY
ncbi:hypothetical protein N9Z33_00225 [Akkermansiaceae bacterium]|nr:hypothetical protein [Akkermansiaceae bacterium]